MRSRRARDKRALLGEAGNASRRKVMVGSVGMKRFDEAQVHAGRRTNRGHCRRVIRTNFGVSMAKIFRENSDSLVFWPQQTSYHEFVDPILRFILAGIISVIRSSFTNIHLLLKWKAWAKGRYFWLRSIGVSAVGCFILVFVTVLLRSSEHRPLLELT